MFDTDLRIAFTVMALLFLRQIVILKEPNKINYAPLMLGIGAVSSIIHFMLHPENDNILLILRESFFPLLVAVTLYIIMNILHQTQQSMQTKSQDEFTIVLVKEIAQLKNFILELEKRMVNSQQENAQTQEEIRSQFIHDIKALDAIKENQTTFINKFTQVQEWHDDVDKSFKYFSEKQLPKLDDVVHKHIDILRISEQDHYNKLQELLKKAVESRFDISDDINELKLKLDGVKHAANEVSNLIVKETIEKLFTVIKDFKNEIVLLKSNAGAISTSLNEGEATLSNIRSQSELIMKQMILSSKKMDDLGEKNSGLNDVFTQVKIILDEIEVVKSDYVKAQSQLNLMINELKSTNQTQLDKLSTQVIEKIDTSLEELHKHYHLAGEDVTKKANLLAKKAQLHKGYAEIDE
ncbi:hypothetical protein [Sulfurimonas sp.]